MASITEVNGKWRALIRRKGFETQCKTFPNKTQAANWARQIEADMDRGITPAHVRATALLVRQVIQKYRDMRAGTRPVESTSSEHYVLNRLSKELGDRLALALSVDDLVGYARSRIDDGVAPSTVNEEIGKLGTVYRYAAPALQVILPDVVGQARPLLNHLHLIGPGNRRERRPVEDELARVLDRLRRDRGQIYAEAAEFAPRSTMRRGEVCKALKADVDQARRMLLVRDRKHPRQKKGNDQWVPLLGRAWEIVAARLAADDGDERLFPIHPQTLSKYWRWACRDEGIEDLRLHDMRHEGTSALFEEGFQIQEVALVTGHKDWRNLKRYTNLAPEYALKVEAEKLAAKKLAAKKLVGKPAR